MARVGAPAAVAMKMVLKYEFPQVRDRMNITGECRGGTGYTGYSQHSWGNALDVSHGSYSNGGSSERRFLAQIISWVTKSNRIDKFGIGTALFDNKDWATGRVSNSIGHRDHIHFSFWPRGNGDPRCKTNTGNAGWRSSSGHAFTAPVGSPPNAEGDFSDYAVILNLPAGVGGGGGTGPDMNLLPLRFGYHSTAVGNHQRRLAVWFPQAGIVIDGEFGSQTLRYVKEFQALMGLTVDGVIGVNTSAALMTDPIPTNVAPVGPVVPGPAPSAPPEIVFPPYPDISVEASLAGEAPDFSHTPIGKIDLPAVFDNQMNIEDYLHRLTRSFDAGIRTVVTQTPSTQAGSVPTVAGHGDELFVGHGPPVPLNTPGAVAGDDYLDMDTGDVYSLKP